jgi:serine/threonine protein kinase
VKIADFGVARLDATEGAITRVGTNIYSAPEHNPLMQTGQLDTAMLTSSKDHLTPAADIYSLAKTTYTLLAGEPPRRFAQHPITELPPTLREAAWASTMLRILEKATQQRPDRRYQTVEQFWDDLAEASLPPTRMLTEAASELEVRRKPSEDLSVEPEDFTQPAPPRPHFTPSEKKAEVIDIEQARWPRIVVPITEEAKRELEAKRKQDAPQLASPDKRRKPFGERKEPLLPASPKKRAVVAIGLVLAFSGMLLATHRYVTTRWNPLASIPQLSDTFIIGREGVTTTDVNLRPVANTSNPPIGLAEAGSKIKVLNASDNWLEVQVVEHGRPKIDLYSSDRGWINKRYVKFD